MEMDVKNAHDKPNDKADNVYELEEVSYQKLDTDMNYRHKYVWERVVVHAALQVSWFIGFYTLIFHTKLATFLWGLLIGFIAAQGTALTAHRYYSHKSFKATTPLRVILLIAQTMSGQNSAFTWARDHIIHHKYSDTDADPHNSNRGFFFSHIGWLIVKKHPLLIEKQKQIDISDLFADKLLMFQYKYFLHLYFLLAMIFPVSVPVYFWNETLWSSFFIVYCFQYVTNLHLTWIINSVAHSDSLSDKTYDKRIKASQSLVTWVLNGGDGWHNFHHAFPWDYRMAESGQTIGLNARMLEFLAYLGLAYDLKTASPNIINGHRRRHGNGSEEKALDEKVSRRVHENVIERLSFLKEE